MILIADSGATKTDWVAVEKDNSAHKYETAGINPYFLKPYEITEILEKELLPFLNGSRVEKVFFYGAGCSTEKKRFVIEEALENVFPAGRFEIYHDLLGAAHALFGNNSGIACILGTGSNSCYYDGNDIVENVTSLGYMYGDEGSGTSMGKKIITAFLKDQFPPELKNLFNEKYDLNIEKILDATYNQPKPNQFFSSFSMFLSENISHQFIKEIVLTSFDEFFENQAGKYSVIKKVPIGFVGSVSFVFEKELKEVAKKRGLKIERIEKNPIDGLVEFYKNKSF
ncbi:MAG: ATPase [Bacteroidales bacterium]|nr:ATPase [Bacteroidales bacterium]